MNRNKLMFIIYLSVILIFFLLYFFFQLAPFYTIHLLCIFLLVLAYIRTEQWITHDAAEFENRFWTFIAFLITSSSFLTCTDSPFYFPTGRRAIGWVIAFVLTYTAHIFDRYLHRLHLTRKTNIIKRIKSADFDHTNRLNARTLLEELQKQINSIDLIWMSSTFLNFFFLPYVLSCEKKILQIFQESNQQEINYLLYQCKLPLILYKIKDHKFAEQYSRSQLLTLLAEDRVHELNVASKAILLDALQRLKLSAHLKNEYYVKRIIFSAKGNDLSELKCLTDAKGDFNSMHKLLFEDLRNQEIREAILNHILKEANVQLAHQTMKTKYSKKVLTKFAWMKIISDVDDTLSCSGGSWPKGMDLSYPAKVIYPGVIGFYRELDLGTAGDVEEWDSSTRIGNLAFLSARPHVYKDVSESFTYDKFRILQQSYHLHTSPTLLPGSLDAGGKFMVYLDSEPLARKKFENFQNYLRIYPEFQFIFIGDNGQGDVRTAELMHEESIVPSSSSSNHTATVVSSNGNSSGANITNNNLARCYMHIVQPMEKSYVKNPFYRKRWTSSSGNALVRKNKEHKICYFVCYVEAAIDAFQHNLIRLSGLRRIMVESVTEFEAMKDKAWEMDNPYDESHLIQNDTKISSAPGRLVKIEEAIAKPVRAPSTTLVKRSKSSSSSSTTLTIARALSVTSSKSTPRTNATTAPAIAPAPTASELDAERILSTVVSQDDQESIHHYHDQLVVFTSQTLRVRNGFVKRELRLRELNHFLERGNIILTHKNLEPVSVMQYPQIHGIGKKVRTAFGVGEITKFRAEDGIYEVVVLQSVGLRKSENQKAPSPQPVLDSKESNTKDTSIQNPSVTTERAVTPAPTKGSSPIPPITDITEGRTITTRIYVAGMYLYSV